MDPQLYYEQQPEFSDEYQGDFYDPLFSPTLEPEYVVPTLKEKKKEQKESDRIKKTRWLGWFSLWDFWYNGDRTDNNFWSY